MNLRRARRGQALQETYDLLIQGHSQKEIAVIRGVSLSCVKNIEQKIYISYGISSRFALIALHYKRELTLKDLEIARLRRALGCAGTGSHEDSTIRLGQDNSRSSGCHINVGVSKLQNGSAGSYHPTVSRYPKAVSNNTGQVSRSAK